MVKPTTHLLVSPPYQVRQVFASADEAREPVVDQGGPVGDGDDLVEVRGLAVGRRHGDPLAVGEDEFAVLPWGRLQVVGLVGLVDLGDHVVPADRLQCQRLGDPRGAAPFGTGHRRAGVHAEAVGHVDAQGDRGRGRVL
jgi:hypothetical protein